MLYCYSDTGLPKIKSIADFVGWVKFFLSPIKITRKFVGIDRNGKRQYTLDFKNASISFNYYKTHIAYYRALWDRWQSIRGDRSLNILEKWIINYRKAQWDKSWGINASKRTVF